MDHYISYVSKSHAKVPVIANVVHLRFMSNFQEMTFQYIFDTVNFEVCLVK